ncbi:MAG: methylmalonyl-CoA mutase family protein [Myxococcota bacterium]
MSELSFTEGFAAADEAAWRTKVSADLKGRDPDDLARELAPGLRVPPVAFDGPSALPEGLRGRGRGAWLVCQEFADPRMDVTAAALRDDLARGAEAVWLVAGLEHGCRVLTPGDLETVLAHVDLAKVPIQLEPEADALGLAAALFAVAESRGVEGLRGGLGADPVGALLRSGTLFSGIGGARRDLVELARHCVEKHPGVASALVQTRAYHDAGATPAQELAWALATGVSYLRWLVEDAGLTPDQAAAQIRFAVGVRGEAFVEIAKLRALRLLWAKAVTAAGASASRAFIHARTSATTAARADAWNNMVRRTTETFAAAVGGADSIACAPFDEAVGPADALARRVARNTQLVLRDEASLGRVDDPAGGSWALERLTDALARDAWDRFRAIEAAGGIVRAIGEGVLGAELDAEQARRRRRLQTVAEPIVGASLHPTLEGRPVEREPVDLEAVEVELGNPFGDARPQARHEALMAFARLLSSPGRAPGELAEGALAAARVGVDLFSLAAVLRSGHASLHAAPLRLTRRAAPFEALREAADAHPERPTALVLHVGPLPEHGDRLAWLESVLAAGGIAAEAHAAPDPAAAGAVLEAALAKAPGEPRALALCAADARYEALVAQLTPLAKAKGARVVLVAGTPPEPDAWSRVGVDLALHRGANLYGALHKALALLGVTVPAEENAG